MSESMLTADSARPNKSGLTTPLRVSVNFRGLWIGQTLSSFGNSFLNVVLPLTVYGVSRSTVQMGLVMALMMIPQVIVLTFAGVLVDRVSRTKLMILADVVRLALVLAFITALVTHHLSLAFIDVFALLNGTMMGLFQPAYSAVRAQVFTPDIRNAANALNQIGMQMAQLIGPSLAGLLIGIFSSVSALAVNAIGFAGSLLGLLFVRVPTPARHTDHDGGLRGFASDLLGGVQEVRKSAWLWVNIVLFAIGNILFGGFLDVLVPWLIKVHLEMPPYAYGGMMSASGLGSLVTAFVYGRRSRWRRRGILAYSGIILTVLAMVSISWLRLLPELILAMFVVGSGITVFGLVWETSLQELVPEDKYGRVTSLDMLGSFAFMPLGFLATGWLAKAVGGIATMRLESGLMIILVTLATLIPSIRRFD